MKYVLLAVFCVLSVSACNATYKDRGTHVHVNDGYNDGNFCPPGQAKKGNC